MKKLMIVAVAALTLGAVLESKAENENWKYSPIGLGIAAPVQIPFTDSHVYGIRLGGIFGWNADVYGIDCGFAQYASGNEGAPQVGAINVVGGDFDGLQVGAVNVVGAEVAGVQVGVLNWAELNAVGLQVALANTVARETTGIAIGGVQFSDSVEGGQIGIVNLSNYVYGFQFGVINACDDIGGVQIGCINLITTGLVPVLPFVNASF